MIANVANVNSYPHLTMREKKKRSPEEGFSSKPSVGKAGSQMDLTWFLHSPCFGWMSVKGCHQPGQATTLQPLCLGVLGAWGLRCPVLP